MPTEEMLTQARKIVDLREDVAEKKRIYKEADQELNDLQLNLHQQMVEEEVKNFTLEGVGRVTQSVRPWARVTDLAKAEAHCKSLGIYDEVFQLKAVARRLNELVKEEYINKHEAIPEDQIGITVTLTPTISIRRA